MVFLVGAPVTGWKARQRSTWLLSNSRGKASYGIKPSFIHIDFLNHLGLDTEAEVLEQIGQAFTVDEVDGWGTVTCSFLLRGPREGPRGEEKTLVGASHHGTPEVTDFLRPDRALPPLALEENLEAHDPLEAEDSNPVDAAISGTAGHTNLNEAAFSKNSLAQPLESIGGHARQLAHETLLPARGDTRGIFLCKQYRGVLRMPPLAPVSVRPPPL
jgi:hypothetical protein